MEISEDPSSIDKYGFFNTSSSLTSINLHKSCARIEKWETMLRDWDTFLIQKSKKLKSRIRKGIPQSLRGQVWCKLAEIESVQQNYPKNYFTHLQSLELQQNVECEIKNDIDRTFPNHIKFCNEGGQQSLYRVLRAYAAFDPEVSYTQGMSFIAGMFLLFLSEEESFWMLVVLLYQNDFRKFYVHGMPKLYCCFYVANGLLRHHEKKVFLKLRKESISIPLYATQWFLTGYSSFLEIETTLRIWDCFWFEGIKVFYRVFLAILGIHRESICKMRFEQILKIFQRDQFKVNTEELIRKAFRISLKSKMIQRLESDFKKGPKQKYIDWVNVCIN
jgi:hypothetical protein